MAEATPVQRHGALRVQGNRIVDKNGKPAVLRGMSLFWSQWMGQYYNRDAVRWLRDDWKCSIVRAAMGVEMGGYLEHPDQEKAKVIAVVDAAIAQGIYAIIDWHDHHAHQHTADSVAFFTEMAKRYGKSPNVIFETYNEPLDKASWREQIKPYHDTVIRAIRQHAPDNLIVCGTRTWSQRVDEAALDPIQGKNIAYTLHFYAATHKQYLRDVATTALKKGAALFVTEYGTTEASGNGAIDTEETKRWWDFLNANGISYCNWSIADKDETSAALKPGADDKGGWTDSVVSASGLFVREEMRKQAAKR